MTGLGIDFDQHSSGHGGSYHGMSPHQMKFTIDNLHFQRIADLMKKLEVIPVGDGTMLGKTVIDFRSAAAESHHRRRGQCPMVFSQSWWLDTRLTGTFNSICCREKEQRKP
tara:strand:+ start:1281 stop:1613 length:333 start_codon:yes stop_codon:yes gene_type:complete